MVTEMIRQFRKKLANGLVLGPFSKSMDPAFVEAMGHAGMDYVILDLEHGPNDVTTLADLIRAAEVAGLLPIVRVRSDEQIGQALDLGAGGVQVPHVAGAERARKVIEEARFAPLGRRGVCRYVRAADYSAKDRFAYFREANEAVIVLQVEGTEGLANLDGILGVEGVDVIFVGVYDLSQSLGIVGQVEDPRVSGKLVEIRDRCRERGIAVGTFVESVEAARRWHAMGLSYLSYSVDVGIFTDACRQIAQGVKG